jgi:hypothetical protein
VRPPQSQGSCQIRRSFLPRRTRSHPVRTYSRPVCLVVDVFAVKNVGKEHTLHLIDVLQHKYPVTVDWPSPLHVVLHLCWNYIQCNVDISMSKYTTKALQCFEHQPPTAPQHSPHIYTPPQNGAKLQLTMNLDTSLALSVKEVKHLEQIVGTFLYYPRAVESIMLDTLGTLTAVQTKTPKTLEYVIQFLDYSSTHSNDTSHYSNSSMILTIHSNESYRSESVAPSRAGGIFHPSSPYQPDLPVSKNDVVHIILKHIMASLAEAELSAIFYNVQDTCCLRITLGELGHHHPPTAIQT